MEKIIHYCWFGGKPLPKLARKCIKSWKKFLPDFEIKEWNENNSDINCCPFVKEAYENKKWAFVADYIRTKALKEYGGIYFDTDMEVTKDIEHLFKNKTFLGMEDTGFVAVGVWFEKEKNAYLPSKLLEIYNNFEKFDIENITKISIPILISEILENNNYKKGSMDIQKLENDITIYPRDYFYPYSYHRDNNIFTDNTCMIHYYDASWLPLKEQVEMRLVRIFGKDNTNTIHKIYSKTRIIIVKIAKVILFPIVLYRKIKRKRATITEEYLKRIEETIKTIQKIKNQEYITFYNKNWMGVTSATKELFENLVDCGELYRKKDIKRIRKAILQRNVKQIIFSSFAIGWKDLVIDIKKHQKNMKMKTFWHGSHSQILDAYGWNRNIEIIDLHTKGYIDIMGTCKKSLMNFYKSQGYKAYFITNKVSNIPPKLHIIKKDKKETRIGIYAAKCDDWRKNMYSQMGAVSLLENAVIDMVPLNEQAMEFANYYGIKIKGIEKPISREELMKRMSGNDVNLYVTFSECAPMLPLESMELGVPCITGNNHHYFKERDIEKYIVVNNESDVEEIKEKIIKCVENKEEIIKKYKKFSQENLKESRKNVKEFLNL